MMCTLKVSWQAGLRVSVVTDGPRMENVWKSKRNEQTAEIIETKVSTFKMELNTKNNFSEK